MTLAALWRRALPYLGVRQDDEHTRYSFRFAERLVPLCGARAEVSLPTMILHDVGWSTVPEDKILEAFGPRMKYPELRRQHELEGVRIAGEILGDLGYPADDIRAVAAIIDGHDTRPDPLSTEDAVVKDADKLWLFTPFGFATVREWFGFSVPEHLAYLATLAANRLHTEPGRAMATGLLISLQAEHQPAPPA